MTILFTFDCFSIDSDSNFRKIFFNFCSFFSNLVEIFVLTIVLVDISYWVELGRGDLAQFLLLFDSDSSFGTLFFTFFYVFPIFLLY